MIPAIDGWVLEFVDTHHEDAPMGVELAAWDDAGQPMMVDSATGRLITTTQFVATNNRFVLTGARFVPPEGEQ